jgi:hypothetical protein
MADSSGSRRQSFGYVPISPKRNPGRVPGFLACRNSIPPSRDRSAWPPCYIHRPAEPSVNYCTFGKSEELHSHAAGFATICRQPLVDDRPERPGHHRSTFLRPGRAIAAHVLLRTLQRNRSESGESIASKTWRNRSSQHENQQLRKRSLRSGRWLIGWSVHATPLGNWPSNCGAARVRGGFTRKDFPA